ncbi:head-tail adaptor protein [Cereibacter sphaeroides]|jgi:head-tail adaptor|uniref:head-tail adaptor protein n=1 Tax=Cereibacter sphaeroides TaxID=1063 RepID=UPI0000F29E30|nr:hypothetical protein Rsph17029_0640 [Cereibacter sphaeroides ATCC 17029]
MAYDRLVQFLRAPLVEDEFGSAPGPIAALGAPVRGSKLDVSDRERWQAGEIAASVTTRFRVRWSPFTAGITPRDSLECEGLVYEIVGVKEVGRRVEIEITAGARTDR